MPHEHQSSGAAGAAGALRQPDGRGTFNTAVILGVLLGFALPACNRQTAETVAETSRVESAESRSSADAPQPAPTAAERIVKKTREVYATWYDVAQDSLARRRAGVDELTAAHNQLPLGTLVRVTHVRNGKTVTVRITDRGIPGRKVKLDLCKEAAEELEMMRTGVARVRMEVLDEAHGALSVDGQTAAPQP